MSALYSSGQAGSAPAEERSKRHFLPRRAPKGTFHLAAHGSGSFSDVMKARHWHGVNLPQKERVWSISRHYTYAVVGDERGRVVREGRIPHERGALRELLSRCHAPGHTR